ncbi:MAG TPA: hypothetical protein PKA28_05265 [Methylomusa anaerophila]|uniref:Outer membrane protein beta-barrel domain-containing protein n=1 Tax=Methylomusa anaerophila TaxID=1930071 RepID=A0A348AM48_9FIRM|nr:hypothetical protein [Methylomusa anaerophila]BBB92146.1 hypothetical protein MAMMFC1_02831 [Methylomusa anaerophila]HML87840.1 hypothetical protein [Methylomusa anaerophila]
MKRKTCIVIFGIMAIANTAFAGPLTDFSQGKMALDVTFQSPKISETYHDAGGSIPDADGKSTVGFDLTAGLGNKIALQYKQSAPKSKDTNFNNLLTFNTKLDVKEYNLLYQLNENAVAFTGFSQVKATQEISSSGDGFIEGGSTSTDWKSYWQLGLTGILPVMDKTNLYATVAFGNNMNACKLGVSYALAQNVDLDAFYTNSQYKNLSWKDGNGQSDFTAKGFGYGVTFKF